MNTTAIEWSDKTWNPVTGCTPVSESCTNCYARRMAKRLKGRYGYPADDPFRVTLHPERLDEPSHIRKPSRIFVVSMGDLFHESVPGKYINDAWRQMFNNNRHTYILLTKRPERMKLWTEAAARTKGWPIGDIWPSWIWLGVTAENQQRADERIPILLDIPAALHFVSCEPMLSSVDLTQYLSPKWFDQSVQPTYEGGPTRAARLRRRLDWVIAGAETGPGKRMMYRDWAIYLREQCAEAGVPFFGKKYSDGSPIEPRQFPQEGQP